jgi:acetyl-CoA carboxylase carboxyl transferase subunit alpha
LWRDRAATAKAAEALRITAKDLFELKLVDEIVPEPLGGAHNDPAAIGETLKTHLLKHLHELLALPVAERLKKRYEKYRAHGHFLEKIPTPVEKAEPAVNGAATATVSPAA